MKRRRYVAFLLAIPGTPLAALAADTWSISVGVRETGSSGAVGSNGGTTGAIEWVNLDGQSIVPDGAWHQYTWNFGTDPITNYSGGNGVLAAANNKGVLENIRIRNTGGNSGGNILLRFDDIVNTVAGSPTTITGFEGYSTTSASSTIMFREPIYSGSTLAYMGPGQNSTLISTVAHSGTQSLAARWTFVPDGSTSQWLRMTTNNTATLPNPVIDFTSGNSLSLWLRASVYNPTGTRATGVDVSSNQGTGIDWNRVAQPANLGGGGHTFAFSRATRGGTSGTSTTGANRVDDSTFLYNIAGAKAAGMLTGPYHFGRPDLWTANDATGLGDAPGSVGTPEDEARHYLEVAGKYMKPGFMRPVYDLEDGDAEQNTTQMSNFVHRFADTLMKYKGPSAKIIVYTGTDYATTEVNSTVGQYPLWMPRWPSEPDWSQGDPFSTESSYGAWDTPGVTSPLPWAFWQYYSPDAYVPGIGGASGITHNDIDVAHGDVNYVRQFLVQGAIWDGSSNATWTTAANWDTGVAPTGSTEVLFDAGIPSSGSTITLSAGRSAGGVYFADSYTLTGGSLTLTDGRIDVDDTKTATVATSLSAPAGFRKVGLGTLNHTTSASSVTGVLQVLQGTMNVSGGTIAATGNLLVNPELTQKDKSLVAPFPTVSEITKSTLTVSGGAVTAASAFVGGTDTASGAIGTLNVSSGSLTVAGALKVWNSLIVNIDSKINLSGGTLSVGSLDTDGDSASFNWTAGTLEFTNSNPIIGAGAALGTSVSLPASKTLRIKSNSQVLRVLSTGTLSFTGGKLDLFDKKLITTSAIGSWNGSNYTGVTGLVETGRNTGVWNAPGITTSMNDATAGTGYTSLAVATASEVRGIGAGQTDIWAGQIVTGSETLVMYTYGGDANLSGNVDVDDYGQIDFNASIGGILTGWFNGDFDYSGIVDVDDYGVIDFVINIQGAPFFTAGGLGMTVTTVPEPALTLLALPLLLARRRRAKKN